MFDSIRLDTIHGEWSIGRCDAGARCENEIRTRALRLHLGRNRSIDHMGVHSERNHRIHGTISSRSSDSLFDRISIPVHFLSSEEK